MWFQAAECNAVNASLLLNLINNNFLIFFNRESSHLYLPHKSDNLRPHSNNSIENATPLLPPQEFRAEGEMPRRHSSNSSVY